LRHGAIDWPQADCFIGQTDAPLSLEGRLQALSWRQERQNPGFSVMGSSDLGPTMETPELIFSGRST
jgi:broad specificity phosphatase PhoE